MRRNTGTKSYHACSFITGNIVFRNTDALCVGNDNSIEENKSSVPLPTSWKYMHRIIRCINLQHTQLYTMLRTCAAHGGPLVTCILPGVKYFILILLPKIQMKTIVSKMFFLGLNIQASVIRVPGRPGLTASAPGHPCCYRDRHGDSDPGPVTQLA